jgi:hypothetical protein
MAPILLLSLWMISTVVFYDGQEVTGPPGAPPPKTEQFFSTYAECMKEIDRQLDELERNGVARRITRYEIESIPEFFKARWECKEVK